MRKAKMFIALLRMALGWTFLYQGVVAYLTPNWSVAPLIANAKTFSGFYNYVLSPEILPILNTVIKGGMIIVGSLLVIGLFCRFASFIGILIELFFYFPLLAFPHVDPTYYIVDYHVIYILILAYLFLVRSGEYFGIGSLFHSSRY